MKKAALSCFSSYSYTSNVISGCNGALIDITSQINSSLIAHDNSFSICENFSNDHSQFGTIIFSESTSILPKQNFEEYCQRETYLNFMPMQEEVFHQPWSSNSVQQSDNELQLVQNARKHSIGASDAVQKTSSSICGLINSVTIGRTRDKKRPNPFQEKQHNVEEEMVPVVKRRSQKLNDKITALQKLVSPYGKTDTASVLLEATISIKGLHHQIEDLINMISGQQTTNMTAEEGYNLQHRRLCLVPSAIFKEFDSQSLIHCLVQ